MWIFGYGSLIWKVDFPYEEKVTGYIKGYHRRFYQHSTDHRGTPEKPGRVVTLIPGEDEDAKVYGIAYRIGSNNIDSVMKYLDYREKGGYERITTMFYPKDQHIQPFEITVYLAGPKNPQYAGPAALESIAQQIVQSVGPSGPNIDYICNLADSMRTIAPGVHDEHLYALEKMVLELRKQEQGNNGECHFESLS